MFVLAKALQPGDLRRNVWERSVVRQASTREAVPPPEQQPQQREQRRQRDDGKPVAEPVLKVVQSDARKIQQFPQVRREVSDVLKCAKRDQISHRLQQPVVHLQKHDSDFRFNIKYKIMGHETL